MSTGRVPTLHPIGRLREESELGFAPDFIFVTGDLANRGLASGRLDSRLESTFGAWVCEKRPEGYKSSRKRDEGLDAHILGQAITLAPRI